MPWREACGQSTSIANEIRRNLDNYTSNQILGELLQNADDAGADRVAFLLDKRTHGATRLYTSENVENAQLPGACEGDMCSLQGPALLAYDSAGFNSEDWKGLMSFGQGSKKMDPTKTGKFGLGFNSVYHLTEVPQFVSGEYWVALDPQRRFVYGVTDLSKSLFVQSVCKGLSGDTKVQSLDPFLCSRCTEGMIVHHFLRVAYTFVATDIPGCVERVFLWG
eukprot:m.1548887 g.1548887  ORF g.1548887 m.1548887 type:complete len:221 (-) comp25264_c0_seq19:8803-9465(-)